MNTNLCNAVVDENRARTGKIARLSLELRDDLNARLEKGVPAESILAWLNAEEETQEVLNEYFGGRPINAQNLSNWRRGGFVRWQRQQDLYAIVEEKATYGFGLSHDESLEEQGSHLCAVLLAELTLAVREVLPTLTDPMERFARIKDFLATLGKVRQQEYTSVRTTAHRERRERERFRERRSDVESHEWRERINAVLRSSTSEGVDSFCTRRPAPAGSSSPAPAAAPDRCPTDNDEEEGLDSIDGDDSIMTQVEASSRSQPEDSSLINQAQPGPECVLPDAPTALANYKGHQGQSSLINQAQPGPKCVLPDAPTALANHKGYQGQSSLIKVWLDKSEAMASALPRSGNLIEREAPAD